MSELSSYMPDDSQLQSSAFALDSVVERYEGRPDSYTIFRSDVPPDRQPSTAITAEEGSYVDLVVWR